MNYLKLFCFLLFFGAAGHFPAPSVQGARVAGEEGVTPAVSKQVSRNQPPASPAIPPATAREEMAAPSHGPEPAVTIDFDEVDIPVFIKFMQRTDRKKFCDRQGGQG